MADEDEEQATALAAPLLEDATEAPVNEAPEQTPEEEDGRSTILGVGINLANAIVGSGIVGLPAALKDAGLGRILQSLHSHDPATHESIFKIKGCFDDCVAGVHSAMDFGMRVTLNFVTTPQNMAHHMAFVEFVHRTFRRRRTLHNLLVSSHPSITFSVMSPQGWGAQHEQTLGRLTDIAASVSKALVRARQLRMDVRIPGLCGFPPCLLPNHADRFDELFEERPVRVPTRTMFDGCHDCAYEPRCSGYWQGYVDQHGIDEFVPIERRDPSEPNRSREKRLRYFGILFSTP